MTTDRRPAPCHLGRCCVASAGGAAPVPSQRRRVGLSLAPLIGALAGLLGVGAGCDVLWRPYIQQFQLADGGDGGGEDGMSPQQKDGAAPTLPATCAQAGGEKQQTGMVTLYIDNDPSKPWVAYCELVGGQLVSYLVLPSAVNNFSQYTAGGAAMGTDVRTTYSALRIDPLTLRVSCGDQRRATSMGMLSHPNSPSPITVTSMPYGVAMGCNRMANGVARIDLRGTQFAVAPGVFLNDGINPLGSATYSNKDQVVDLAGGGFCGWQNPKPGTTNPLNAAPGIELQLVYSPM